MINAKPIVNFPCSYCGGIVGDASDPRHYVALDIDYGPIQRQVCPACLAKLLDTVLGRKET